jgi:DNA-binding NtrC family response regulator
MAVSCGSVGAADAGRLALVPREPAPPDDKADRTRTLVRSGARPDPLAAVVRVVGAKAEPATFRLTTGVCLVGSAPPCDIVISDPTVSRAHAELYLVPEGVAVRDTGSRNGTFYQGQRIEKIVVSLGTRIELGSAAIAIEADARELGGELAYEGDSYRGLLGQSARMRRLFALLQRLEGSLATVLVEGESGVGKELVARALHEGSSVAAGPLVTLNCGAIPPDLVASELFGHARGAFTGAVESRSGAFEEADGGTLLLDEIGELPMTLQPALLRALESGEVRPVGGGRARTVKVRIVAATNRDLEEEVARGAFREDLFYRLAVVRLPVPPLRERPDDVELLARAFAKGAGVPELPREVVERLKGRSFPGNARELRNAIQAYAALGALPEPTRSKPGTLRLSLGEFIHLERPYAEQKEELVELFTGIYLDAVLAKTGGNQTAAARLAGLDRTHLGRLLLKRRPPKGSDGT